MGRVKKYTKQHSNKHRKVSKNRASNNSSSDNDEEMVDRSALPIAKRTQILKALKN